MMPFKVIISFNLKLKSDLAKLYFIYFQKVFNTELLNVSMWLDCWIDWVCFSSQVAMRKVIKGNHSVVVCQSNFLYRNVWEN